LRESGKTLVESSTRIRSTTAEPGACRASLNSSLSESAAKRQSPAWYAALIWPGAFTGFENSMSAGSIPSERRSSSSPSDAISKPQPRPASASTTSGAGLHLTA